MRWRVARTVAVVVGALALGAVACRPVVQQPGPSAPPPTTSPTTTPVTAGPPVFTGAWQQRLADRSHSSHTTDATTTPSGVTSYSEQWRRQVPRCAGAPYTGGGLVTSPVIFKGVIFAGGNNGCLLAVNETDGTIKWSRFVAYQPKLTCSSQLGIASSVTVADDGSGSPLLTFHAPDGYLYRLNGNDGSTISRTVVQIPSQTNPPGNDVYAWSSPTPANGRDYVGISSNCDTPFVQGKVVAFDRGTGQLTWSHSTVPNGFVGAGVWTDLAVDDTGNVWATTGSTDSSTDSAHPNTHAGFEQQSLIKLDGATGNLLCKAPAPNGPIGDADYASSPILFAGTVGGVANTPLAGATNKDGWFRVYKQGDCSEVWEAQVGAGSPDGLQAPLAGGAWDGTHLFVMGDATSTGGQWVQSSPGAWKEVNGTPAAGSIRELDPSTGGLVSVNSQPFEIPLPSNPLGPCTLNGSQLLFCSGGNFEHFALANHDNGIFAVDITASPPARLTHLEDVANFPAFGQLVLEHGHVIQANSDALVLWG
jgi:outer membrane protein assembly factor BamB